jgi:hypothetical protein
MATRLVLKVFTPNLAEYISELVFSHPQTKAMMLFELYKSGNWR